MDMRILTLKQLIKNNACEDQLELFRDTFGRFVEIEEPLAALYARKFNFEWAAGNLLSAEAYFKYSKVRTDACVKYDKVRMPAWVEYEKVRDTLSTKERDAAFDKYEKVTWLFCWEYKRTCATTFARLYITDQT